MQTDGDGVTIRPIEPSDLDRILELNQANVPEVSSLDDARLRHLVEQSAIGLAAECALPAAAGNRCTDARTLAGFCLVLAPGADYDSVNYRWFTDRYDDVMYLDRVAFDASFRGRGLGSALYAEVDRLIRLHRPGATALTLEVNVDPPNDASLAFHCNLGFTEVGRQMSKGIEVSLMRRPIE